MRGGLCIFFESLSIGLRRLAGRCFKQGHPLRQFHSDLADLLEGASKEYLHNRSRGVETERDSFVP